MGAAVDTSMSNGERHRRSERRDAAAAPWERAQNRIGFPDSSDRSGSVYGHMAKGLEIDYGNKVAQATGNPNQMRNNQGLQNEFQVQGLRAEKEFNTADLKRNATYEQLALEIAEMRARDEAV